MNIAGQDVRAAPGVPDLLLRHRLDDRIDPEGTSGAARGRDWNPRALPGQPPSEAPGHRDRAGLVALAEDVEHDVIRAGSQVLVDRPVIVSASPQITSRST